MRTEALRTWLEAQGATLKTWQGVELVASSGEFESGLKAARDAVVLADRNHRMTLSGTGLEVVKLVQALVTGDVYGLAEEGRGMVTTAVDLKGRLIADLRIFHMPDALIFDGEPEAMSAFLAHARRHVIMEDAQFKDRTTTTARLAVIGPQAVSTLDRVGRWNGALSGLADYHVVLGRVGPHEVVSQATPVFGVPAFELYVAAEAGLALLEQLQRVSNAPLVGDDVLEEMRVGTGFPRWGVELDTQIIPLEADMNYGVSYSKGCYLGQEIIARLDTRGVPAKMLRRMVFEDGHRPEVGAQIVSDGTKVGAIRSVTRSGVALGYVKRGANEPGATVTVDGHEARLERLPPW